MATHPTFFTDASKLHFDGQRIASIGEYTAWGRHKEAGGDSTNWPTHSIKILDLKNGKPTAVSYFLNTLDGLLAPGVAIAIVPSHQPNQPDSQLRRLAQALASSNSRIDATHCIARHTKIEKLAKGGDRSLDVHLKSLRVDGGDIFRLKSVVILDDVTTSGNSLLASQNLVTQFGPIGVQCLALGRTV
jgi:hypothetical protein